VDVVLFGIVLVLLTAFVAAPLYAGSGAPADESEGPDVRHESLVSALRELEVDRASGLLTDEGYEAERSALEAQAAD